VAFQRSNELIGCLGKHSKAATVCNFSAHQSKDAGVSRPRSGGAEVISHGRYVTFQMAEVAVPRQMFQEILSLIARLRAPPALA
jgi:hypothetical protein